MSTMSGACVWRARFAAADGRPMPTKHTQRSHSSRAAATVIISSGVNALGSVILRLRHPDRAEERRVVRRAAHVLSIHAVKRARSRAISSHAR